MRVQPSIAQQLASKHAWAIIAILAVFFISIYPNIGAAIHSNAEVPRGADPDWHDALVWMRENTPEPFEDPDFYYDRYERPAEGQSHLFYPESAYGVMSWWDYGYWIARISHRIPNAIPGQAGAREAGLFFTAQDEPSGNEVLDQLGSRYVIIDDQMTRGKFYAMADWAGLSEEDFLGVYFWPEEGGRLVPRIQYYPAYYRSMCSRLYNYAGRKWDPHEDWIKAAPGSGIEAISYAERMTTEGLVVRMITDEKRFTSYEEARQWVDQNPGYQIVGDDPLLSPVPLEELEHYKLVYRSPTTVLARGEERFSQVHIFEYVP
jgi:dolichyl-diphosphooligosaccharide--protein glycosyltransferase